MKKKINNSSRRDETKFKIIVPFDKDKDDLLILGIDYNIDDIIVDKQLFDEIAINTCKHPETYIDGGYT